MSVVEQVRKPLGVRVTQEQHRVIREAAEREHRSVASFVVNAAMRAALLKDGAAKEAPSPKPKRSREELRAIIVAAREEFQTKNPGRDPLEELFAERREAAARGE